MDDNQLTQQLVDMGAAMPVEARKQFAMILRAAADGVDALGDAPPVPAPGDAPEAPAPDAPVENAEKADEPAAPEAAPATTTEKAAGAAVQWGMDLAKSTIQADTKKAAGPKQRPAGGPSWPMDMGN